MRALHERRLLPCALHATCTSRESAFMRVVLTRASAFALGLGLVIFNHSVPSPFVGATSRQSSFPVGVWRPSPLPFLASLSKSPFRCRMRVQISTDAQNARPTNKTAPIHKDAKNEDGAWVWSHSQRGKKWRPLTTSTPEGLAKKKEVESSKCG